MAKLPPDLQLDDHLCFALYGAALAVNRAYKPLLDQLGITYPQYLVLAALWDRDGQAIGEIADRLALEPSTITPLAKRMESASQRMDARFASAAAASARRFWPPPACRSIRCSVSRKRCGPFAMRSPHPCRLRHRSRRQCPAQPADTAGTVPADDRHRPRLFHEIAIFRERQAGETVRGPMHLH
jgi:hypothetical protein